MLASRFTRTKRIDGFVLRGRELAAEKPDVFQNDPVRLIRVFRHLQTLEATLDFHLADLIRISLPLLTPEISNSHDANVSFRSIVAEVGAVHPILARMHDLGVLGRFIPEFEALTDAWRSKLLKLDELNRIAKKLRVQRVMQPYLETVVL